jgi:tetracycline repressor-like protein
LHVPSDSPGGLIDRNASTRVEPLASLPADAVVPLVGPTLQRYLDRAL